MAEPCSFDREFPRPSSIFYINIPDVDIIVEHWTPNISWDFTLGKGKHFPYWSCLQPVERFVGVREFFSEYFDQLWQRRRMSWSRKKSNQMNSKRLDCDLDLSSKRRQKGNCIRRWMENEIEYLFIFPSKLSNIKQNLKKEKSSLCYCQTENCIWFFNHGDYVLYTSHHIWCRCQHSRSQIFVFSHSPSPGKNRAPPVLFPACWTFCQCARIFLRVFWPALETPPCVEIREESKTSLFQTFAAWTSPKKTTENLQVK